MAGAMTRNQTAYRILFALAVAIAVIMALLPHPPHLPIDTLGDKFEHSLAFAALALLAAGGFPATPLARLGERLSFLGALIEVFQSIPALHRDCDVLDWATDTIAITVALLLVAAARRRAAVRKPRAIG
jgi:hypothetical protein